MNRRHFLRHVGTAAAAVITGIGLVRAAKRPDPIPVPVPRAPVWAGSSEWLADAWRHYAHFEQIRRSRQHLLAPGERWLIPTDIAQPGDAYLASDDWWAFQAHGGTGPGARILGDHIFRDCWCYTPKGSATRINA